MPTAPGLLTACFKGAPRSFILMPSMPSGGTAFTSPATFSCLASASTAAFSTWMPALAVQKTTSALCSKWALSASEEAQVPSSRVSNRRP